MRTSARPGPARRNWLFSIVALLSMATQLMLAATPLLEGRDDRMASHIEAGGTQTHVAHNDATCASCQARSIHSTAPRTATSFLDDTARAHTTIASVDHSISIGAYSPSSPRAPPAVI
jgi:hypothetical protein